MCDEKKAPEVEDEKVEELDDTELEDISGGRMRGHIVATPTTDISEDTIKRI